jgi:hypothetical protein
MTSVPPCRFFLGQSVSQNCRGTPSQRVPASVYVQAQYLNSISLPTCAVEHRVVPRPYRQGVWSQPCTKNTIEVNRTRKSVLVSKIIVAQGPPRSITNQSVLPTPQLHVRSLTILTYGPANKWPSSPTNEPWSFAVPTPKRPRIRTYSSKLPSSWSMHPRRSQFPNSHRPM